jgi:hypothetical protein
MAFEITSDTVVKILVRRGLEVERTETLLSEGELGYSVDSQRLFIGDGYNLGGNPVGNIHFGVVNNRLQYEPFAQPGDMIRESNYNYVFVDDSGGIGWANINPVLYSDTVNIGGIDNLFSTFEYSPAPGNSLRINAGGLGSGLVVDYLVAPTGDILNTIQRHYSTINFDARFLSLCSFKDTLDLTSPRIGSLYFGNVFTSTTKNNLSATVNIEKNLSINDHTLSAYQLQMYARDSYVNNSLIDATSGSLYIRSKGPIYLGTSSAGGSGLSISDTNVTVFGNLSVLGDLAYLNSVVSVTSALSVVNNGTGPAFVVNQKGAQPVAHFQDDGASALYIEDGGNVGIGTTNPTANLDVYNASNVLALVNGDSVTNLYVHRASPDAAAPFFNLRKSRGTVASPVTVNTNDNIGDIRFIAFGGTNERIITRIRSSVETYVSDTNISSNLTFETSPAGGVTPIEYMRINSTGNIGIATTLPAEKLTVSGNISSNGTLFTKQMTAYGLDLVHTPITDGTDPVIRIGESSHVSPNLGFSGAYMSYDELTNVFGISSVFADGITQYGAPALAIDRIGNVGIGTMVPDTKLHVSGSLRVGRGNELQFNSALKWASFDSGSNATSYMKGLVDTKDQVRIDTSGLSGRGISVADATNLTMGVGSNIALDTATGSKIGTATTQKLSFYNSTPIVQPSSANQAAVVTTAPTQTTPWGFTTSAQAAAIITLVNEMRTTLVNLGLMKGSA